MGKIRFSRRCCLKIILFLALVVILLSIVNHFASNAFILVILYPPQTLFVGGILFSRCPSVRNVLFPLTRRVIAGFSSNLANTFMQDKYFRQKSKG